MSDLNKDAIIFRGLLDTRFKAGEPRRHAPGTRSGEQEVFLEPSPQALSFILGPPPDMVRAIRPKLDDQMPVRQRHPSEIVGHRLQIRQFLDDSHSDSVGTTYYLHRHGELKENKPPLLRREVRGGEGLQYVRHLLPSGEAVYEGLGALIRYSHDQILTPEEVSELFRFVGSCTVRDPREFE